MFDELLTPPPSVDHPASEVIAPIDEVVAPVLVVSTGSPSSTTVDQDAPSPSNSQTTPETQSPILPNDVEEDNHDLDVAHMNNDPFFGITIPENDSEASSLDVIPIVVQTASPNSEHITKCAVRVILSLKYGVKLKICVSQDRTNKVPQSKGLLVVHGWPSEFSNKFGYVSLEPKKEGPSDRRSMSTTTYDMLLSQSQSASQILCSTGVLSESTPNGLYSVIHARMILENIVSKVYVRDCCKDDLKKVCSGSNNFDELFRSSGKPSGSVKKGTVRFGNDNFAAITAYGDYIQCNITICHVYYVEGDDFLTGGPESNLYAISISDMATSSPVCLMSKATSTKSWLWHCRLSHLNFGTINDLTRLDLVDGLPVTSENFRIFE
ncbi:retrovirus-related pol polyprotein from transposon TNT 1-94 [Tanacetum coccineum]